MTLIFICPFDPFGRGWHLYWFENTCKRDAELRLEDSAIKVVVKGEIRMSEMFDVLNGALDEAIADAKSEKKFLRRDTISIEIEPLTVYSADEVKEIRHSTGLTQSLFAKWLGVSTRTVEAWEAGRNTPSGPSSRLLQLLQSHALRPVVS